METPVWIRVAGPDDAELVADIARRTFIDTFSQHNTAENMRIFLEEQNPKEKQMAEVGAPGRTFFLAYVGDEPAGFVSLRVTQPPAGLQGAKAIELVQIYSEQKMIGKGVGHALMEAALESARLQGYDWIWLGVWEHNHRAQAFYRKWGFERCGEHVFIVGLDAQTDWWMKKNLA